VSTVVIDPSAVSIVDSVAVSRSTKISAVLS
jgi:hypothetical protein